MHMAIRRRSFLPALVSGLAVFLFLGGARPARASGHLSMKNLDLGMQYTKTGPVGYFDLFNTGTDTVHLISVTIPPSDTNVFKFLRNYGAGWNVPPIRPNDTLFTPIGVFVNLQDTLQHTTTITVVSDADDSIATGTLTILGREVFLHTSMQDMTAHAFEFFSIPVVVTHFYDQIGTSYVQRYSCNLSYDPTLLTFDTSALTKGVDTQGVSSGFTFKLDSPYTPGQVLIHASGPTGGIHEVGDTVFKLAFQANQFLFVASTEIRTVFSGDSGFHYANFSSDSAIFTTLPCLYPVNAVHPATAEFIDNHPNPFNPSTRLRFRVDGTGFLLMELYDRLGRWMRTLVDGVVESGVHELTIDCSDLPSGPYFCRLSTPLNTDFHMITLSR